MRQFFRVSPLRKQLAWNTAAQIFARAFSSLAMFGVTILIARQFGANGYGDYVKITTFVAFFYLIADFGINAVFLQRSPLSHDETSSSHSIWEDLLALRLVISCVLLIVSAVILWFLPDHTNEGYTRIVKFAILIYSPTILFQALITSANALFQKYLRYDLSAIAVVAGSTVSFLLVLFVTVFWRTHITVISVITALNIGGAVTAATGLLLTRRLHRIRHSSVSLAIARSLFISSIPLGLTLLFNLVYFRVDSIILTLTRPTAEVGIYGLAYKVFELTLVLPTFFMNALYPVMLQATSDKRQATNKLFQHLIFRSAIILSLISCLMSLILWFIAPAISLVKADFIAAIPVLRVLSFGLPFFFLSSLTMWTLIAKKQQKILAIIYAISMVFNILLNILFIPRYGYMAAAWVTVISEGFVLLCSGVAVYRVLSIEY